MHAVELVFAIGWAAFWIYWLVAAFSMKRGRVPWSRELRRNDPPRRPHGPFNLHRRVSVPGQHSGLGQSRSISRSPTVECTYPV
jgi:uncharacterized membrane protein YgcG